MIELAKAAGDDRRSAGPSAPSQPRNPFTVE
jgi:hypothetical protein